MLFYIKQFLFLSLLALMFLTMPAHAQTPTNEWVSFYSGQSELDGEPIPVGAKVTVYDATGILCGKYIVDTEGSYGFLACYFDDAKTEGVDEGITAGDQVTFRINDQKARVTSANGTTKDSFELSASAQNGDRIEVHLSAASSGVTSAGNQEDEPIPVPEPITIILFGTGLAGLAGRSIARRRKTEM